MQYIGFILLIASVFIFGLQGMTVEMGIAVVASAIFLAFTNLDKFASFKGAGFEAELRQVVNEANATIENLKDVAGPLINTSLIALTRAGRLSFGPFNEPYDIYDKLVELERKIGLKSDDLEKTKYDYLKINAWSMINDLSAGIERDGNSKFSVLSRESLSSEGTEKAPDLKKFKELLVDITLNKECQEKLDFIEKHYAKYKL